MSIHPSISGQQLGSGVNGEKKPTLKIGLKKKYLRRESADHKQQRESEAAFRDYYRELHGAVEIHEIARRSKSKEATSWPENCLPCPSREYHEMVQNEPIARQIARKWIIDWEVILRLYGKPVFIQQVVKELGSFVNLRDD